MEKSKKSINVEGGFLFCGGWNFSKLVSMGPTFIREMRVLSEDVFGCRSMGFMPKGYFTFIVFVIWYKL